MAGPIPLVAILGRRAPLALVPILVAAAPAAAVPGPPAPPVAPDLFAACGPEVRSEPAMRRLAPPARDAKLACVVRVLADLLSRNMAEEGEVRGSAAAEGTSLVLAYCAAQRIPDRRLDEILAGAEALACDGARTRSWIAIGMSFRIEVRDPKGRRLRDHVITACGAPPPR